MHVRTRPRSSLAAALALLLAASPASAQTGTFPLNIFTGAATTLSLGAGTYTIQATSGSWNAWGGAVGGCDSFGANCSTGYLTNFHYALNGGPLQSGGNGIWATPALALANAPLHTIVAPPSSTLQLQVMDSYYNDNVGSLGVTVAAVTTTPEPASLALFATGFAGIVAVGRRRRPQ